ncbi:ribosome biogenesis GTP-binding protein YihA/YsxC [Pedobacter montanisoli]|uniref:Probable GTP-binding protein EngB n=1 Tax=Pedobacter montanisoli TaxID=2923277 RepID=A0ABS9ZX21_9SPHI|nr:ribosome biogenesis GTP-binding protein YihA/YsxC [Pedobacter montanisoli]MCJ0742862.1 ribosome biogenesis GTP-binding protein YihA/YsxC [Pedobacter montanisoli]
MLIKSATFVVSNTKISALPAPDMPEYAFIGRSNVGKSSLINMLVNQKGLAKTSQKPGKTQLINHFLINGSWYIVDLPGYGYAKVSKSSREKWEKFIRNYLTKRESLQCVFVLVDSRLEPQQIDLDFCCWLGECGIAFVIVYTKADKQSINKSKQNMAAFNKALKRWFEEVPASFLTSSESGLGKDDILTFVEEVNSNFVLPDVAIKNPETE